MNSDGYDILWELREKERDLEHYRPFGTRQYDAAVTRRLDEAQLALMKELIELADFLRPLSSSNANPELLRVGEQISPTTARSLQRGHIVTVRAFIREIGVSNDKINVVLQDARVIKGGEKLTKKSSPPRSLRADQTQPLSREECDRIIRQHIQKGSADDLEEMRCLDPDLVRVGYGLHLVNPSLQEGEYVTAVDVNFRGLQRRRFWIRDGTVVHQD